nr:MAG TPA: hypothetical protein [Caudoviricetes sp.]
MYCIIELLLTRYLERGIIKATTIKERSAFYE